MNSDAQTSSQGGSPGGQLSPEELMAAIESGLEQYLADTSAVDLDAADEIDRGLVRLGRLIRTRPPASPGACAERLRRIETLHSRLALRLAQQREETAARLARLQKGKVTLKAYGRGV